MFFVIDAASYDPQKHITQARWTIVDARKAKTKIERKSFQQNIYSHSELKQMLIKVGFKIDTVWGLLHGEPFVENISWHQTILARKL